MDNNAKLRPLYLAKILYERTDEDHYLTTMQLAQILEEEYGIPAHRQTIKTDIELLQQFGMDIQEVKSTQNRYNLISRQFEIAELKLLIDAVQSSKFISKERSEQMVSKIVTLAGQHKAEELKRNASVEGRVKSENRQDLLIVDAINEAINARKKIAFQYFSHGLNYQKLGKELMSQDEIAVMDGGKCILQLRGVRPFFSDKYDITRHPKYKYLSDYDKKNTFDIEKFLKRQRRPVIIKPDTVFDYYEIDAADLQEVTE